MKCSVIGCRNFQRNGQKKSFFRFPKEQTLRKKWLEAIARPDYVPAEHAVICENHFLEDHIQLIGVKRRLRREVVPSVNIHSENSTEMKATEDSDNTIAVLETAHDNTLQTSTCFAPTTYFVHTFNGHLVRVADLETPTDDAEVVNTHTTILTEAAPPDFTLDIVKEEPKMEDASYNQSIFRNHELLIKNIEDKISMEKCMETSSDSCTELSDIVLVKKAKLKKLRKYIRKNKKLLKTLQQKVRRQNKRISKLQGLNMGRKENKLLADADYLSQLSSDTQSD